MPRRAPPAPARWLLSACLPGVHREFVMGDLEEEYHELAAQWGVWHARRWYWRQAVGSLLAVRPWRSGKHAVSRGRRSGGAAGASLTQDLRFALRSFARRPGFAALAVLTLALGIGPTTAIFSLADWIMLRPIPGVREPDELAMVWYGIPSPGGGFRVGRVSYPNYEDLAGALRAWSGLAGSQGSMVHVASADGGAERLAAQFVTASYFPVLGLEPRLGRVFAAEEDDPVRGGAPVVVISHRLWRSMFAADSGVIGRTVRLNDRPFTVVGVLPAGFHGTERTDQNDIWLPGSTYPYVNHFPESYRYDDRARGGFYEFVGRLAPGVTWGQAEAELRTVSTSLAERYPGVNEKFREMGPTVFRGVGLPPLTRERLSATVYMLFAVVGLILIIACGNVANLLLFRATTRRGERAVRTALGATAGRLARQHVTEHLLLWLAGGAAGLLVAWWLVRLFEGTSVVGLFAAVEGLRLDWRVAGFALAVSLATGAIFGLVPTIAAPKVDVITWLKDSAPTGTASRSYVRSGLSVLQMSATVALLVVALLFARTLYNLTRVELGFRPEGVVAFGVNPGDQGYSEVEVTQYYRSFLERLGSAPAVQVAAVAAQGAPFAGVSRYTRIRVDRSAADTAFLEPLWNGVTEGYLDMLGIPLIRGRWFDASEVLPPTRPEEGVVVLSAALAGRLFDDREAVGQSVEFPVRGQAGRRYRVVGVVGDVRWNQLDAPVEPMVYEPLGQDGRVQPWARIVVRERVAAGAAPAIRSIAGTLDSGLPVSRVETLQQALRKYLSERRLFVKLTGLLALLAVTLAAVGLYGVVAFGVAARTREFGVRVAVGAEKRDVLWLVLRQALRLAALGAALGLVGAVLLGRLISARLYAVSPLDPMTYAAATGFLVLVGLVSALVPARAATRVDPIVALRYE